MLILLTIAMAATISALLTFFYIKAADGRAPVAEPNHRSMHKGAVVVGGGWPLLAAAFTAAVTLWPQTNASAIILLCMAGLAALSWIDDIKHLAPPIRLAAHTLAVAIALSMLPDHARVFQGLLPFWPDRILTGLALVWFINLYNFMDGIDGISGVETISLAGGYLLMQYLIQDSSAFFGLAAGVVGAAAGFLIWNWHPARIFLGDIGAVPIGLLTGWLMIDLATSGYLAAALILPLYYVADATITIVQRLRRGEKIWEGHRSHFYQRATSVLNSHAATVKRIAVCNVFLIIMAGLSLYHTWPAVILAIAAVLVLLAYLETTASSADAGRDE